MIDMERRRPLVILGFLGVQLDSPRSRERFSVWRPTVGLCQQEDLLVDRFELWVEPRYAKTTALVVGDIARVSPSTMVRTHALGLADAWDFEEVFVALRDFARGYPFDPEREDYLVHVTTGTHVAQICLFLLTETGGFRRG
jgi:transcriptional regulatory protein RtcR